jgi:hypothetical protein
MNFFEPSGTSEKAKEPAPEFLPRSHSFADQTSRKFLLSAHPAHFPG